MTMREKTARQPARAIHSRDPGGEAGPRRDSGEAGDTERARAVATGLPAFPPDVVLSVTTPIGGKWVGLPKQAVGDPRHVTVILSPDTSHQSNFPLAALDKDAPRPAAREGTSKFV